MLPIQFKQIQFNTSKRTEPIKYIVVHYTANYSAGANPEAHYKYFSVDRQSSADIFVDDKTILQINDYLTRYSWAVGDGAGRFGITNGNSLSIEICVNSDSNLEVAKQNTLELCIYLCKLLNIPAENVKRHFDASKKNCPVFYTGAVGDVAWEVFKNNVVKGLMVKPMDYKEILMKVSTSGSEWIKTIDSLVAIAKTSGNIGDLERCEWLPTLIENIYKLDK